jgi:hypothetical protein
MKIIAIDPGKTGYVVELDNREQTCKYLLMPMTRGGMLDYGKLDRSFPDKPTMHFIEKVSGRAGWGAGNIFVFGYNTGLITAWLYDKPYTLILPQTWQKLAHMGTDDDNPKIRSYQSFKRLNPSSDIKASKDGLIDAFHIARYGMFQYGVMFADDWNFVRMI